MSWSAFVLGIAGCVAAILTWHFDQTGALGRFEHVVSRWYVRRFDPPRRLP